MKAEPIDECNTVDRPSDASLLDCYMELIAFAGYSLSPCEPGACENGGETKVYDDLVERSRQFALSRGFSEHQWIEGLFPVCAYIDEVTICSKSGDTSQWEKHQLQRKYFNTTAAGREFFQRLDSLNGAFQDIRAVYEFCLALGFKGQYFRTSDIGRIEDIRYAQLKEVAGLTDLDYPETLFPEAYETEAAVRERKSRKRKTVSFLVAGALALPLVAFMALYFLFDRLLDQTVARYFGIGL